METTWKKSLAEKTFFRFFAFTCIVLIGLIIFAPYFFQKVIAPRPGVVLNDWVLALLPPRDFSMVIFILIYSSIALTIVTNFRNAQIMAVGIATYAGVTWLRLLTIYLFALDAPQGIVLLSDPLLSRYAYPDTFVKDLFFSGHLSTMMVLILIEPRPLLKWIKAGAAIVVSILILVQHVHYTIDIIFAPAFTYLVYRLVLRLRTPPQG